ncbi:MAG: hypothetical protein SV062_04950 [Thermodesulfobacteriota bacterium]|nr:hypothetical protein [Thermodesulfobacteriota bacterium]
MAISQRSPVSFGMKLDSSSKKINEYYLLKDKDSSNHVVVKDDPCKENIHDGGEVLYTVTTWCYPEKEFIKFQIHPFLNFISPFLIIDTGSSGRTSLFFLTVSGRRKQFQ